MSDESVAGVVRTNVFYRVIMDARVAFEMRNGSPVTFSFATADQLKSWPKLVPPTSHNTPQRVTELQKEKIGAYYVSQSLENRDE